MVSSSLFEFRVYAQDNQTSDLPNLNTKAEEVDDNSALIDKRNTNQKIQADSKNIPNTNPTTDTGIGNKNNESDFSSSFKATEDDDTKINNNKKAYKSGYNHGCSDAKIPNPSNRYTNQPERGPSFHTPSFNKGYQDGFDKCSKNINQMPIANAGQDKTVLVGQSTILDGSKSYDPDGTIVKYSWTGSLKDDFNQCAWTIGAIDDSTSATPRFTATKNGSSEGCHITYQLIVTDNNGIQSKPDEVVVTINPVLPQPPGIVVLSDIHTTPQNVYVNDTFKIYAKITNNLDIPIEYTDECKRGPLYVKFDKEIKDETGVSCVDSFRDITVEPHTSTNIGSGGIGFISENPGQINSQVTFGYSANGKSDHITKPYSFNILNKNCGINPHAPPCCIEPTKDKSCIQSRQTNLSNINTTS